ncbi:MAG: putative DNA binding domain-containing protein [Desulfobacterales bacterium]|uniref:Putative DNA binding domain-containing protein n=1 Tax=Candidatus Desulfatibia vada TaxID=2841696 RepID=A0A8J6TPK2_9BACT|nr:putative DNA binding domain-containing protein [Candidatus Desulfatibia vada]
MDQSEIVKLIKKGESKTVEFKETFDNKTIETAVAFANTRGGHIFIGVSDKGAKKGVQIGKETLIGWTNKISQGTQPRIIPEVESLEIESKIIAVIQIKEFPIKPVSTKGRCYRRVGNSNRLMTPQDIAEMHLHSIGTSWDKTPAPDATMSDIDPEKIKSYIRRSSDAGRRDVGDHEESFEILKKLELIKEGKLTWAALLLFRKDTKRLRSQGLVHCGRFKEETIVIDNRMIEGTIVEQIDEAMDFIRKNISVKFVMTGKPQRDEVWDYPLEAIRESIINAVCHRDYTMPSNTEVRIYDDRLTIWNPGGLPLGISMDDLFKPHGSVLRNKGIGAVLYDMGLIEQWGSGIGKMLKLCSLAGIPAPHFEEYQIGFLVEFRKDIYTEEYLSKLGLNERQQKAVHHVKTTGKITNQELRDLTDVVIRTASRDLEALVRKGVLVKMGKTGRSTHYVLVCKLDTNRTNRT